MSETKRDDDVVTVFVHSATGHSGTYELPREPPPKPGKLRPAKLRLTIAGVQICDFGEVLTKEEMRERFNKGRDAMWKQLKEEGNWPPTPPPPAPVCAQCQVAMVFEGGAAWTSTDTQIASHKSEEWRCPKCSKGIERVINEYRNGLASFAEKQQQRDSTERGKR